MFIPYSALIKPSLDQSGAESLAFDQTFQLKLEINLINSVCT